MSRKCVPSHYFKSGMELLWKKIFQYTLGEGRFFFKKKLSTEVTRENIIITSIYAQDPLQNIRKWFKHVCIPLVINMDH